MLMGDNESENLSQMLDGIPSPPSTANIPNRSLLH